MNKLVLTATTLAFSFLMANAQKKDGGYPISPVSFTSVKVTDNFWGQRLKANRKVTIPLAFSKCEESGRYDNFMKAAHPSDTIKVGGLSFDDTDVYKTIEGASYSMQTYPDKKLEKYIDSILVIVAAAQEPDGYLYTSRTMNPKHPHEWAGSKRWEKEEVLSHELYDLGHMVEGAIAYYQATGKRNFLDIAIKYADCVDREIGNAPGKEVKVPGHQIAEMALARLYLVTGQQKYLNLAKFFLDERGHTSRKDEYSQTHKPVVEQDEAVGHAVRAVYMYAGMADVAALTGDSAYIHAIDRIWENAVSKKLYITGGIGARHDGEAFGDNYELPNLTAYCETCAAIGNVYWNYRMFLLHGDAKFYDVLERTLYNGLISGVSLDGGSFFYPNPLESDGVYKFNQGDCVRQPWFGCACCPSNISRFIPSLPSYIYAVKNQDVYVNLFMSNTSNLKVDGKDLNIIQTTNYPWEGDVRLEVNPQGKQDVSLKLRIPGWARNEVLPSNLYSFDDGKSAGYTVALNGEPIEGELKNGYFMINRTWKKGDVVNVHFDMQPRIVKAHPEVKADKGKVAFERGPLVYCAEWPDNDFKLSSVLVPSNPEIQVVDKPELLHGIKELKVQTKDATLTLIPYYAWCHRGKGDMSVWLPREVNAVKPMAGKKETAPFAKGEFKEWAQTPPMGWNSWDCYGSTVREHEVKANADYMADKLKKQGWEYIVVDIRWFVENDKAGGYNQTDPRYVLDEYGRYQPAVNRFPSAADGTGFKKLADYVHGKGLKFGIHIMRGIPKAAVEKKLPIKGTDGITANQIYSPDGQCKWLRDNYTIVADKKGAQEYYNSIFDLYAAWGVDFVKIDDLSRPYHKAEIELIRNAIDRCGRPIVLSLSPGETPIEEAAHVKENANMWRMVDDVWDLWRDIKHLLDVSQKWYPYIAQGTWPDCDMIPLGRISIRGERGEPRMTNLSKDEQYTLMTLFTIFRSPLMFGGDLPSNDAFTLLLLTNEEVLRMHRESTDVSLLFQDDKEVAITSRNPRTNEVYLAFFNISDDETKTISVNLKDIGLNGEVEVMDMWTGEKKGKVSNDFSQILRPHVSGLYKFKP